MSSAMSYIDSAKPAQEGHCYGLQRQRKAAQRRTPL